jgi:hypothetical protein
MGRQGSYKRKSADPRPGIILGESVIAENR